MFLDRYWIVLFRVAAVLLLIWPVGLHLFSFTQVRRWYHSQVKIPALL